MIFTAETIGPQLDRLRQAYPNLAVTCSSPTEVRLHGQIQVYMTANDFTVRNLYVIDIVIPLNSHALPTVFDAGRQIKSTYPHRYQSGELCLATETQMRVHFVEGFDLVCWMENYVEPYFFSYEYYKRYQVFPFGDRAHGYRGILQTYQDFFETKTEHAAYALIEYLANHPYRGHICCPCGSGEKIRNCHGVIMLRFYDNARLMEIVKNDFVQCQYERRNP